MNSLISASMTEYLQQRRKNDMAKEFSFEEQMKKLQEIVEKLEKNDIDLDESIRLYEEGLKLSKQLKDQLDGFEEKIAALNKGEENE